MKPNAAGVYNPPPLLYTPHLRRVFSRVSQSCCASLQTNQEAKKTWNGKVQTNIRTNNSEQFVDPEVLQIRFGVTFYFGLADVRKIARTLLSEFTGNFFAKFQPCFSRASGPPKINPKIHPKNSRPELSASLSNFTFLNPKCSRRFSASGEDQILREAHRQKMPESSRELRREHCDGTSLPHLLRPRALVGIATATRGHLDPSGAKS